MATIKDVARLAGVSLGTASNVLNGKESVKPESREKVYQAMKELDFQYNMAASSLRTKATKNMGLIIPTITNPYYPELARGAEDGARKAGCTLFLCNSDRKTEKEKEYIDALLSRRTDGLILVKTSLEKEELEALSHRTTLVLVDYREESQNFSVVNMDDTAGVMQGMGLLRKKGHSRIAFISGLMDSYSSQCRIEAYKSCMEQWQLPGRQEYIVSGDYSWLSGYQAAKKLLELKEPPTAIFAANDIMAMGAIKAASEMGIQVPRQLSVLGYDDIEMSNLCTPPLSTIHQPKYQVGVEAVRLLMGALGKQPVTERLIWMQPRVIERDSVSEIER